jgi:3-dehydroquinate synthase
MFSENTEVWSDTSFSLPLQAQHTQTAVLLADAFVYSKLEALLPHWLRELPKFLFPQGEESKSLVYVEKAYGFLAQSGIDRNSTVYALGGGAVLDVAGFVCATFKRGISYVSIPTSLLAMVDAAHGGKTAINTSFGKNLIGSFHLPKHIFIHTEFLHSLDRRELISGHVEMYKHGLIRSIGHAYSVEMHAWDRIPSEQLISESIAIKKSFVVQDPKDNGIRNCLNFGHSIGHAIEAWSHTTNTPLLHGEAIALGIVAETYISQSLFGFHMHDAERIYVQLINYFRSLIHLPDNEILMKFLLQDKKNNAQHIRMALLKAAGEASFHIEVPRDLVLQALDFVKSTMC